MYASPILTYTAYKRGYFTAEGQIFLLKLGALGALTLVFAFVLRALGRATNPTYMQFNNKFRAIIENYNEKTKVNEFSNLQVKNVA